MYTIIAPCVATGAFYVKSGSAGTAAASVSGTSEGSDSNVWGSIAGATMAVAALAQVRQSQRVHVCEMYSGVGS